MANVKMDTFETSPTDVGEILNFSAIASATPGDVSIAVAFRRADGLVFTFTMRLPAERALGYSEKLSAAVNAALRYAPRRAG
jgi:hypothetical protein